MTTVFFSFQMLVLLIAPMLIMTGLFAAWRYWDKRQNKRRSPLSESLLRSPGESLLHELRRTDDQIDEAFLAVMIIPALMMGIWWFQHGNGHPTSLWVPVFAVIVVVAWSVSRLTRVVRKREILRLGYEAERAVAQNLSDLLRDGYSVFHDLPTDTGNIDHVVVGPSGVYAIETKGRSKGPRGQGKDGAKVVVTRSELRFPTHVETQPIEQAKRQAQWLAKWLSSATGTPVAVSPVLALPGWFVDAKERLDMLVFNGKNPRKLIHRNGPAQIDEQAITRITHQLRQRCEVSEQI